MAICSLSVWLQCRMMFSSESRGGSGGDVVVLVVMLSTTCICKQSAMVWGSELAISILHTHFPSKNRAKYILWTRRTQKTGKNRKFRKTAVRKSKIKPKFASQIQDGGRMHDDF